MNAVATIMNTSPVNAAVVRHWKERASGRKTIAFGATVAHAQAVCNAFLAEGVSAAVVHGDMSESDRKATITSGTENFKPHRFEGGGMRFLRFKQWLNELLAASVHINAVYFEEVRRHAGVDAAHAYGGFMGHLTAWCEHHNIPYQGVPVGTIKKHATGKGNAGKDEMIAAAKARGHDPVDDNEADALALLHWAIETQEV